MLCCCWKKCWEILLGQQPVFADRRWRGQYDLPKGFYRYSFQARPCMQMWLRTFRVTRNCTWFGWSDFDTVEIKWMWQAGGAAVGSLPPHSIWLFSFVFWRDPFGGRRLGVHALQPWILLWPNRSLIRFFVCMCDGGTHSSDKQGQIGDMKIFISLGERGAHFGWRIIRDAVVSRALCNSAQPIKSVCPTRF